MKINTKEELDKILTDCRAILYSEIMDDRIIPFSRPIPKSKVNEFGEFYNVVKSQCFLLPDRSIHKINYLDNRKAIVVVPITNEGNIVFIVQPIALSKEGALLELLAGCWDQDENAIQATRRELEEGTGYFPMEIVSLGSHYQDMVGIGIDKQCRCRKEYRIRQVVEMYLALGCERLNNQKLDNGEFVIEVPYDLAWELMDDGYLKDASSYIALSKAYRTLQRDYGFDFPILGEEKGKSRKKTYFQNNNL